MARPITLFVLLALALTLSGCDSGGGTATSPTSTSRPTRTSAPMRTAAPTRTIAPTRTSAPTRTPKPTATTVSTGEGVSVSKAVLARGYENNEAVDPTTEFAPEDTFHLVVELDDPPDGTRAKAAWTAVDAGGEKNVAIDDKEVTMTGVSNIINFTLTLPRPWPEGDYKVDLYVNDTLKRTLDFTVNAGVSSSGISATATPASSVGSTGSNAEITSAVMATGFENNEAVGVTTTFPPETDKLHCVLKVSNAADDTKVKAIWTAIDAKDAEGATYKNEKILEKGGTVGDVGDIMDFTLTLPNDWPIGSYKVELYLDDVLEKTVNFEIK